jgi:hypothetical protein
MTSVTHPQTHHVNNFYELVTTPFNGTINAIGWKRELKGDFAELVAKIARNGNVTVVEQKQLLALDLSEQGQLARDIILSDWKLLEAHGASPVLNVIEYYDRDEDFPFFPTDVYSFHVDRSPIATDTFLCTYYGEPSEIIPNPQCEQKVWIPEIRAALKELYDGEDDGFEAFLTEYFFDLHYQAKPNAQPINLGLGNLWRLAVDYPGSPVLPCVHRAPHEKAEQPRLLMIC